MRFPSEYYERYKDQVEVLPECLYAVHDGIPLHLDLMRPKQAGDSPLPVIIWIHGGGWGWRGNKGGYRELMNIPFAAQGYLAVGVEYRLSTEACFPAQIHDIKAAVRWLRANLDRFGIDGSRFGAWGRSAGAHLAYLLGTSSGDEGLEPGGEGASYSDSVQAVVGCFGPTDLSCMLDGLSEERVQHIRKIARPFLGGEIEAKTELADLANPIAYVTGDCPPFLLVHGREDKSIPLKQAQMLNEAIIAAGGSSELIIVENGNHGFLPYPEDAVIEPDLETIHDSIQGFFRKVLVEGGGTGSNPIE